MLFFFIFWPVAPLLSKWKHRFECKGVEFLGLPGLPIPPFWGYWEPQEPQEPREPHYSSWFWGSRGSQGSQYPHFEGIGSPGSPRSPRSPGSPKEFPGLPGLPTPPFWGFWEPQGAPGAMLLFLQNDVSKSKEKEQLTKIQKNELCLNNILSKTSTFTFIWLSAIRVRVKNPVTETFHSGGVSE